MRHDRDRERAEEPESIVVKGAREHNLAIDYLEIPKKKLVDLLRKMKLSPRELLRTKEPVYKTLRLAERDLSDEEIVELMVKNPDLIQRPIVEKGGRAILARPAERLKEIL